MLLPDHAVRLLRAMPDAAVFVTPQGEVVAANAAARDALGLNAERPVDARLSALVRDPATLLTTLRTWSASTAMTPGAFQLASGKTFNAKGGIVFPREDEDPAILVVRFWPRDAANPFVLLSQKVIELNDEVARRVQVEDALRRSEAALRERADEAEALNRAKDEFLATVSHELRTPLNAILGWSTLLDRRALDAQVEKGIDVIRRNAESQAKIIDDILDVSRIITGKLLLEMSPTDISAIVDEAVEVVRPSADAKQIAIAVARPTDACMLIADPDRLRQAIWNLLSNAVKFTDRSGRIHIAITRESSRISVVVSDTGRGIEPAFLPFVFDRFRQGDGSPTRRTGGLGLGLSLVRHIVELHGGAVTAESEGTGRGATFTMTLPIRAVASAPATAPHQAAGERAARTPVPQRLRGMRILVVDDEPDARELVAEVLASVGAEVDSAGSVSEAFEVLARTRPVVIVSDVGMPDEDGHSFMRRVRALAPEDGGSIPSLALTAYARGTDRTKALAAGFTAHIGKPVDPDELVAVVADLAMLASR